MKSAIHPNWHHDCTVTCSCGNTFVIGSTNQTLQIDICDKCHPFFTGEVRFVDRQGRVDKFLKQQQVATQSQASQSSKRQKKAAAQQNAEEVKSYRELLRDQQSTMRESTKEDKSTKTVKSSKTEKQPSVSAQ